MKNITHLSIFKIENDKVFENVNSYKELNDSIKKYGLSVGDKQSDEYRDSTGMAFEIFTQFFCIKYGDNPLLGIRDVNDTSDDPFNEGFDFTYTDYSEKPGQIQSKWRSNPTYQFKIGELATNGEMARNLDIDRDNNILFINFDDSEELFNYKYVSARNARRVIGRDTQEEFIRRDPKFWKEFRECIKKSAADVFEDPYKPREIQEWILNGTTKDNIEYKGTDVVLNGELTKGRIEASTGAGKTLCQFYNIERSLNFYNKKISVIILPTISLISQTFREFYQWKLFGHKNADGSIVDSKVSCLIIRSGTNPRYNNLVANVFQTLDTDSAVAFINKETRIGRKVVIFSTMKSKESKYQTIIDELNKLNLRVGLEVIDEYHNIISSSSKREKQEEIAEYLKDNTDRSDATLFYSASNKFGEILSSFNEDLFGPLLAKVNRNDLRVRGFVCPKLIFKLIRVKPTLNSSETKRDATRINLDIDKAQTEAVASISAYKDLSDYYPSPNLITFGDHVEGCRYISESEEMTSHLPNVNNHFMAAKTTADKREKIIDSVKASGGNIIHQHSVAKEGINLPNLHGGLIGRDMNVISLQQSIGRSDRALYSDTLKLEKGLITLDNPDGWEKYYNVIYLIVDDTDSFADRVKKIVKYLLDQGIPEAEWDISFVDDEGKGGQKYEKSNYETNIDIDVLFDSSKFKKMIDNTKVEIQLGEEKAKLDLEEQLRNQEEEEKVNTIKQLDDDDFLNFVNGK
jgi:superfamily II DNA or RNA helicase